MLRKIKFKLVCLKSGEVYGNGGEELYELFFSITRRSWGESACQLINSDSIPFTLGRIRGKGKRKSNNFVLEAGRDYYFTCSVLTHEMDEMLQHLIEELEGSRFSLGSSLCMCVEARELFKSDYHELIFNTKAFSSKICFDFVSPTSFGNGESVVFPTPEFVFNNLSQRWNCFGPWPMYIDRANEWLIVNRYQLRTYQVTDACCSTIGFQGPVQYSFNHKISDEAKWQITVLSRFATFAGIGDKTTQGMGEVILRQ